MKLRRKFFICPICGKTKFFQNGTYDICKICGWENDKTQNNDPDYAGGANNLSLNEYKKRYELMLIEKPGFIWSEAPVSFDDDD